MSTDFAQMMLKQSAEARETLRDQRMLAGLFALPITLWVLVLVTIDAPTVVVLEYVVILGVTQFLFFCIVRKGMRARQVLEEWDGLLRESSSFYSDSFYMVTKGGLYEFGVDLGRKTSEEFHWPGGASHKAPDETRDRDRERYARLSSWAVAQVVRGECAASPADPRAKAGRRRPDRPEGG